MVGEIFFFSFWFILRWTRELTCFTNRQRRTGRFEEAKNLANAKEDLSSLVVAIALPSSTPPRQLSSCLALADIFRTLVRGENPLPLARLLLFLLRHATALCTSTRTSLRTRPIPSDLKQPATAELPRKLPPLPRTLVFRESAKRAMLCTFR